jgi:hypothetical protein
LPALNWLIRITTPGTMATQLHPPLISFALGLKLPLASAPRTGQGMAGGKSCRWLQIIGFVGRVAVLSSISSAPVWRSSLGGVTGKHEMNRPSGRI